MQAKLREICFIKHLFMFYCSRILLSYNNSFRILSNLPMGCNFTHTFAIGNVISGKGIISKPNQWD